MRNDAVAAYYISIAELDCLARLALAASLAALTFTITLVSSLSFDFMFVVCEGIALRVVNLQINLVNVLSLTP